MPELVPMPKLGFDMAEGTLVRKVKRDGEAIKKGEVLAEIETDKATVEIESPAAGVVKGWVVDEGQPVPVGALMAVIGAPDEQVDVQALRSQAAATPSGATGQAEAPATAPPGGASADGHQARHDDGHRPAAAPAPTQPAADAAAPISPIARKMAADAGVDLRQIPGSGPGGRITKKDVENYLQRPQPAAPAQVAAPPQPAAPVAVTTEDQAVPLTRMRQTIARRMTEVIQSVPQFYVSTQIDMDAAMALRQQLNGVVSEERKISVNDFIIKAAALALREFPNLNASYAGDKVVRKGHVNVGNAVALEAGLITVVVKDADVKSLAQIAVEARGLVKRARQGRVQPGDIEGSTFSLSNLGMYAVDHFIAIINPPEAAILAVGTVEAVPVVRNGAIVPGQRLLATVSADHRVTDGAEAARFLQAVKQKLEEPLRLLL